MPGVGKRGQIELSNTEVSIHTEVPRYPPFGCSKALQITPQLGTRVGDTEVADCISRHFDATLRMGSHASNRDTR